MGLWTEIFFNFADAYMEPKNEDFIKRVYEYADWCLGQESEEDARFHLPTCVCICFWENIPTCKEARDDMPRWFSLDEVIGNQHFFKYLITDDEFEGIKRLYLN